MRETIRKAELMDIPRIRELCANIWDGDDYLPNVVADWIKDPVGEFCVIEVMDSSDAAVGDIAVLGKLTILNGQDGWLEGLRGNVNYRGQGYAQKLTRYFIEKARAMNLRTLRLGTYYFNSESIHILHKHDFREVQRFVQFNLGLETGDAAPPEEEYRLLTMVDLDALWPQIAASPWLRKAGGFISHSWVFWQCDRVQMERWIADRAAYLFPATGEIGVFHVDHHEQNCYQFIPLMTNGMDAVELSLFQSLSQSLSQSLNRLVKLGKHLALESGRSALVCNCPDDQALFQVFFNLGFRHFEMEPPEVGHTIVLEYDLKQH